MAVVNNAGMIIILISPFQQESRDPEELYVKQDRIGEWRLTPHSFLPNYYLTSLILNRKGILWGSLQGVSWCPACLPPKSMATVGGAGDNV
jgi:hypothetical protein